ncbi:MAG: hypothetical protein FD171_1809 [Actinobacteria bacterium]|nr:MAG: hypothetical protein FD171_1809 [Actinomycetota bacterium]
MALTALPGVLSSLWGRYVLFFTSACGKRGTSPRFGGKLGRETHCKDWQKLRDVDLDVPTN